MSLAKYFEVQQYTVVYANLRDDEMNDPLWTVFVSKEYPHHKFITAFVDRDFFRCLTKFLDIYPEFADYLQTRADYSEEIRMDLDSFNHLVCERSTI